MFWPCRSDFMSDQYGIPLTCGNLLTFKWRVKRFVGSCLRIDFAGPVTTRKRAAYLNLTNLRVHNRGIDSDTFRRPDILNNLRPPITNHRGLG
jgi:hypothetical protein